MENMVKIEKKIVQKDHFNSGNIHWSSGMIRIRPFRHIQKKTDKFSLNLNGKLFPRFVGSV